MSEKLKQRIVGTIVLVSLAVIFLPIILDGSGQKRDNFESNPIPDRPDMAFKPLEIPLKPIRPETKPARVIDSPDQATKKVTSDKSVNQTVIPTADENTKRSIETWVVQVGSFSHSSNALNLRDKLRKNNHRAFVDEATSKEGKLFYRVRVGPYKIKLEAEAAKTGLSKKLKLDGKVMKHP